MKSFRIIIVAVNIIIALSTSQIYSQESKVTRDFFGFDFWAYDPALWQGFLDLLDEDSINFGLLGFNVGWEMIEPDPPVQGVHKYNWERLDELMQIGVASGRVFDMNILIRSNWATVVAASEMDESCCDMSPPKDDADSDTLQWGMTAYQAYSDFIFNMVERYDADGTDDAPNISHPAIKYLQLGDEPDATSHFIEYGGSPEIYGRMMEAMYLAAKRADTNMLVVRGKSNPGGIFDDDPSEQTLLSRRPDYLNFISANLRSNKDHFDIFAINYNDHYTGLIPFARWLKAEMAKNGYNKPIMVGDARTSAWPRNNDGGFRLFPRRYPDGFAESITDTSNPLHTANRKLFHADEARQSLRKLILALASGQQAISLQPVWGPPVHERMFWQDAGLLDSRVMVATKSLRQARKPVYFAAKQLMDALIGANSSVVTLGLGEDVYAFRVSRQGKNIFLLWHENQFDVDSQNLVRRWQTLSVDLSPYVSAAQLRVRRFVAELDSNRLPIYPQDTIVLADELLIDETPVMVEAYTTTSVWDAAAGLPNDFTLLQNHPNPFSESTIINYKLSIPGHVELRILDAMGQEVRTLFDEYKTEGNYSATWNGRNGFGEEVAGGIFFFQMRTNEYTRTKKLLLFK